MTSFCHVTKSAKIEQIQNQGLRPRGIVQVDNSELYDILLEKQIRRELL